MPVQSRRPISILHKLKLVFYPDRIEVGLMLFSIVTGWYLLAWILGEELTLPGLFVYGGLIGSGLFSYRWCFSSIYDAERSRLNILQRHAMGEDIVVNFKVTGLLSSFVFVYLGWMLA
jgi:hypothetical protein